MNQKYQYGNTRFIKYLNLFLMQPIRKIFEKVLNHTKIAINLTTDIYMDLYKHAMRKHFNLYFEHRLYRSFFALGTNNNI